MLEWEKKMKSNLELLKIIVPFLAPYKKQILIVFAMLPLSSVSFSVQPVIMQRAVDGPLTEGNINGLGIFVLALLLAVIINFVTQIVQFWLINSIGQNVIAEARYKLFAHLERLPMSFFDRTPVGRSVSRITSDMEQLSESLAGGLVMVALDAMSVITIFVFMLYLNVHLTLMVSVFLIPIYYASNYYQEKFREANLNARNELSKLNSFLQQNIVGISVVHALSSIEKSMRIFADNNRRYFKANDDSIKADAQLSALIELVSLLAIVALVWISMKIIGGSFATSISVGIILAFLQYTQSLFEPIRNLTERFTVIQSAFTALERIKQLLDEKQEIKDIAKPKSLSRESFTTVSATPIIEFNDVWFRYAENSPWVLQGVNCKIHQGEKIAFIGKTGSGKTTIIKLLTRLYEPSRGSIKVCGIDIRELKQDELRTHMGTVHQDSYIFAGDLLQNIQLNRKDADIDWKLVEEILRKTSLSLTTKVSERATNISSGEEQVINFARVFAANPSVIIFDEASSKIDVRTENHLQELLEKYIKNKTVIYIAHRLETLSHVTRFIAWNTVR